MLRMFVLIVLVSTFSQIAISENYKKVDTYRGEGLAIGKIEHMSGPKSFLLSGTGSGSMAGKRLMLTAEHTMNLSNGKLSTEYVPRFAARARHNYGEVPGGKSPVRIVDFRSGSGPSGSDYSGDWAIAILETEPQLDEFGYKTLPVVSSDSLIRGDRLRLFGYPNNASAGTDPVEYDCRFVKRANGMLYYTCGAEGTGFGSSGGPVLANISGVWSIVGIHTATYKTAESGNAALGVSEREPLAVACATDNFLSTFRDLERSYGGGGTAIASERAPSPPRYQPIDELRRATEALERPNRPATMEDVRRALEDLKGSSTRRPNTTMDDIRRALEDLKRK